MNIVEYQEFPPQTGESTIKRMGGEAEYFMDVSEPVWTVGAKGEERKRILFPVTLNPWRDHFYLIFIEEWSVYKQNFWFWHTEAFFPPRIDNYQVLVI